jgi:hypothetical protein
LVGRGFSGLATGLHAGVAISPSVVLGVDFQAYRTSLESLPTGKYRYKGSNDGEAPANNGGVRLTSTCSSCGDGAVNGQPFYVGPVNVLTLGPRLQFAPDPSNGFYGVVSAGYTFLEGVLTNRNATSFGARAGYKIGVTKAVGIGLELGGSTHTFRESTAVFGFGGAQLLLRI